MYVTAERALSAPATGPNAVVRALRDLGRISLWRGPWSHFMVRSGLVQAALFGRVLAPASFPCRCGADFKGGSLISNVEVISVTLTLVNRK
jgi:hypothetical protein